MGNKEDRVLVDRLKPHLDKEPIQPAVLGHRGQPRPKQDVAVDAPSPTYAEVIAGGGGGAPRLGSCIIIVIRKIR